MPSALGEQRSRRHQASDASDAIRRLLKVAWKLFSNSSPGLGSEGTEPPVGKVQAFLLQRDSAVRARTSGEAFERRAGLAESHGIASYVDIWRNLRQTNDSANLREQTYTTSTLYSAKTSTTSTWPTEMHSSAATRSFARLAEVTSVNETASQNATMTTTTPPSGFVATTSTSGVSATRADTNSSPTENSAFDAVSEQNSSEYNSTASSTSTTSMWLEENKTTASRGSSEPAWNETEFPQNDSYIVEASIASEEFLEESNLTGNLSNRTEEMASEMLNGSNDSWSVPASLEDDAFFTDESSNDSDFLYDGSTTANASNASEDLLEENDDDLQLDANLSNWTLKDLSEALSAWNESVNDSSSHGQLPDNTSAIAGEATTASSEDFLEEDNESVELSGNLSGSNQDNMSKVSDTSNGSWSLPVWNETELPVNSSVVREAINASEDLLEDDNESTELDGNLSDATDENVSAVSNNSHDRWISPEDVLIARNISANESDAWNQTEPPDNGEATNASDAREDDNESATLEGNLSNGTAENLAEVLNSSNGSWILPEGMLIMENKSANDSDVWNETELPINSSVVTEAINASEDLLEDDNESTELDGNLSDATAENVSAVSNNSHDRWIPPEDVLIVGNVSANESDAWNETEPSDDGEASNASDALEDDNESSTLEGNLSDGTAENLEEVSNSSNGSWILPEGMLIMENKSANDSDVWNETELPINSSVVTEAINASEDLLEDDNESTELDGNLSDATEDNVSEVSNRSNDSWILPEDVPIFENESVNHSEASDGWNETEVPVNISVVPEDVNVSEDLLEDDNESTELDGNLSDATKGNVSEVSNSSNDSWILQEDMPIFGNESVNHSDASDGWNETEVPVNISVVPEDVNVSEDLLEDDNESTELDGNLSDATKGNVSEVSNSSNDSWILPEDMPIFGNESVNHSDASDGWNETEVPVNISVVPEDVNVSEDLLEDDNESTELDGNLSDATEDNVSEVSNSSNDSWILREDMPIFGNESVNHSDASDGWNETEVPVNISVVPEDVNVSEDLLEDDNESTELDGNLSDATKGNVSEVSNSSNDSWILPEDVLIFGNESANDSDGNVTEVPINISVVPEDVNVSEDLLADDNESTELDGNLSDATEDNVSEVSNRSNGSWILPEEEDVLIFGNESANDSDGWNETEPPLNISVATEAINVSEDLLQDDNESTELDGNLSDASEENTTEASNGNNSSTTAEDVDVLIIRNESANDSDASDAPEGWNETEPPLNISVVTEAINVSEDLLEDDNESTELDGNLSDATEENVSEVSNSSNGSWILPEDVDVLIIRNESANDSDASDGWNETEPPLNISVVTEAINVSEDLLEDDNESTELDGNLSDATEENVSEVSNSSNGSWILPEDVLIIGNESANDSDGWNETEPPVNISVVTEAINVSEDLLEDDNESTELDGNLSDAKLA
ncbi:unnamed protein product [Symbiodinium sp. CCMP2592]|nr:unnamed protein product [Symbiodinium sp. CCMP2592]